MISSDVVGKKQYCYKTDWESFEFNKDLEDIELYIFSESLQAWIKADLAAAAKAYPATYQDIFDKIHEAMQQQLADEEQDVCWSTAYKNARGF